MKSFTTLQNLATNLSTNTSSANQALMAQLMNDAHRYLIQKYFSNEGTFSITTVGAQSLTVTGTLAIGDISATLNTAWAYYTTTVVVTFSSGQIRNCRVFNGSTSLAWDAPLTATATASISVQGLQFYPLPPNYSKLKDLTINVGQLKYVPKEILTRQEWDQLNVFPYYGDIPNNFFIYPGGDHGGQIGIWPIPSTTGNLITFNYKLRIPDLSLADYATGTVSINQGAVALTGSGTTFIPTTNPSLESRWIQIAPNKGDNLWYQVANVTSTTGITLYQPYQGISVTAGTYILGQMPILAEDFQDMLIYKPLYTYFSSINKDKEKAELFNGLYQEREVLLEEYSGSNTINVNLARTTNYLNPNLFPSSIGDAH